MTKWVADLSPTLKARLAGVCYLITIGVGAFDNIVVGGKLVLREDAAATAHNIVASEQLYRLAFAADMVPIYIVVTLLLYDLLKPVNSSLALLAVFSSLVGGAVGSVTGIFHLAPLVLLKDAFVLGAFTPAQVQALTLACLRLFDQGFSISLEFFGFYCFLIGCLIVGSTFLPRVLGALMVLAGLAYMTYSFAYFISPSFAATLRPFTLLPGFIGEGSLTVWLLAVGVDAARWRHQASAAGGPPVTDGYRLG